MASCNRPTKYLTSRTSLRQDNMWLVVVFQNRKIKPERGLEVEDREGRN